LATTDNSASLQKKDCFRLIDELKIYLPNLSATEREKYFVETGVIDASRLLELVHSKEYGVDLDSRNGRDLSDGANSKLSCSYAAVNGQGSAFGWRFKVKNAEGDVILRFSNPLHKEVYSARIPHAEIKGKNFLVITDCVKGGVKGGKYGKYITVKK